MNKKQMSCLWMILCLMVLGLSGAFAQEDEHLYYAFVYGQPEATSAPNDVTQAEALRLLYVSIVGAPSTVMVLPGTVQGTVDEYLGQGVRLSFEEALPFSHDAGGYVKFEGEGFENLTLRPTSIEIAGEVIYGTVEEIGNDDLVLSGYGGMEQEKRDTYTLTEKTVFWYEEPFVQGSGCEVIVTQDGTVLAMSEANG